MCVLFRMFNWVVKVVPQPAETPEGDEAAKTIGVVSWHTHAFSFSLHTLQSNTLACISLHLSVIYLTGASKEQRRWWLFLTLFIFYIFQPFSMGHMWLNCVYLMSFSKKRCSEESRRGFRGQVNQSFDMWVSMFMQMPTSVCLSTSSTASRLEWSAGCPTGLLVPCLSLLAPLDSAGPTLTPGWVCTWLRGA